MEEPLVHYEVFVRNAPTARWVLEIATEKVHMALATAEDLVKSARVAAAMVTKETFDEKKLVFHSEQLFHEIVHASKRKTTIGDWDPLCVGPADLYTDRVREKIGALTETWLARNQVTPYELLHSVELVDRLEAASNEMQHAIQKFAVAEVQVRGGVTHEIIRRLQGLLDGASSRLRKEHGRGAFKTATPANLPDVLESLAGDAEASFRLGGSIAAATAQTASWREKVVCLLGLLDAVPEEEAPGRALALSVIDQIMAEMVVSDAALQALVGDCDDLGRSLMALTCLIVPEGVGKAAELDERIRRVMPEPSAEAQRLAERLAAGDLRRTSASGVRRILGDLQSHKRLCPDNAAEEIMVLRALAMSLSAAAGSSLPEDDVLQALSSRSRSLLSSDFLEAYIGEGRTARGEAEALLWLANTVVGGANKRRAGRLVQAAICTLKFETEALAAGQSPPAQLAALASLQRAVGQSGLLREEALVAHNRLGALGAQIEAKAQLIAVLLKSQASPVQKLSYLLRLASGETAPLGPVADRAKMEALKLVKDDALRAELASDEGQMAVVRDLIKDAGLAA